MLSQGHKRLDLSDLLAGGSIILLLSLFNLLNLFEQQELAFQILAATLILIVSLLLLKRRDFLLDLLVFTIPLSVSFPVGSSSTLNGPSELLAVFFAVYVVFVYLNGKAFYSGFVKHPLSLLLAADLLWMLVTTTSSQMPEVSLKRWIVRVVYFLVYYVFFASLFAERKVKVSRMLMMYCIGLIIPIVHNLIQHSQIGFAIKGSTIFSRPYYNDHTVYGAALVFFLPFLFYYTYRVSKQLEWRLPSTLLFFLFLMASFLSYSRAAWLSLIIAVGLYLIVKWKFRTRTILIWSCLLIGIAAIFSNSIIENISRTRVKSHGSDVGQHFQSVANISTDASNIERLNRWKCAWRMFMEKPLLGFGPGTYQFFYGEYQVRSDLNYHSTYSGDKGHAHSEYLNYLSETGLPGLLIFTGILIAALRTGLRVIKRSRKDKMTYNLALVLLMGLCTFAIHSFFNGFIESDKMAMPVLASYAALVALDLRLKKADAARSEREKDQALI